MALTGIVGLAAAMWSAQQTYLTTSSARPSTQEAPPAQEPVLVAGRLPAGILGFRVTLEAGCALYGLSDEIHQLFVPLRQGDPLDLVADSVGAALGAWTWRLMERRAVQSSL